MRIIAYKTTWWLAVLFRCTSAMVLATETGSQLREMAGIKKDWDCNDDLGNTIASAVQDWLTVKGKPLGDAIALLEECVQHCPKDADCWYNLGVCYHKSGVHANLGIETAMKTATLLNPVKGSPGLAMVLNLQGRYTEAENVLSSMLEHHGSKLDVAQILQVAVEKSTAICMGSGKDKISCSHALDSLGQAMSGISEEQYAVIPERLLVASLFLKAQLADHAGKYDQAWQYYETANNVKVEKELGPMFNGKSKYMDEAFYKYLHTTRELFSRLEYARLPRSTSSVSFVHPKLHQRIIPIFILGLPRTGSSLLEQVLSCHQNVFSAGEVDFIDKHSSIPASCETIEDNTSKMDDPMFKRARVLEGSLHQMRCWMDQSIVESRVRLEEMSLAYLTRIGDHVFDTAQSTLVNQTSDQPIWITDKLPMNWRHLPLLRLLFPQAVIIETVRHPADVALSNYFADYLPPTHWWAHSLDTISLRLSEYNETMSHWKEIMSHRGSPNEQWYTVSYESVVESPLQTLGKVIQEVGIRWDATCIEVQRNKRSVFTASSQQVKQPLYTNSVARWQRYPYILDAFVEK